MSDAAKEPQERAENGAGVLYTLRGVEKSYRVPGGRIEILKGLDLDVFDGEFLLIQGRSGIGKSTLLHIMGLLDRPDAGVLRFRDRDVTRASSGVRARIRATRISFVFQFYHLLAEFTAIENVLLPGKIANGPIGWWGVRAEARERAAHLLGLVGLSERMSHRPGALSGGERQRVALARALFNRPDLVLCDEPTGNLDVRTSEEIHELLARLSAETGQTMVVVTHDPEMERHASRVIHLADGRAIA